MTPSCSSSEWTKTADSVVSRNCRRKASTADASCGLVILASHGFPWLLYASLVIGCYWFVFRYQAVNELPRRSPSSVTQMTLPNRSAKTSFPLWPPGFLLRPTIWFLSEHQFCIFVILQIPQWKLCLQQCLQQCTRFQSFGKSIISRAPTQCLAAKRSIHSSPRKAPTWSFSCPTASQHGLTQN